MHDITDNLELWKDEDFSGNDHKPILSSTVGDHSLTSCTFISLSADHNGGAIYYSSGHSLSIEHCIFTLCKTTKELTPLYGGGAIFINTGSSLSVISSTFIACSTLSYGGGIFSLNTCKSSTVCLSTFIDCNACHGGGVMSLSPLFSVSSSRFLSCIASQSGGGLYYDNGQETCSIAFSELVFSDDHAHYVNESDGCVNRGGGGLEDYRTSNYSSNYFCLFFTGNTAPSGVGNDISIHTVPLVFGNITRCFTTTSENSFWNTKYEGYEDWLPLDEM